MIITITGKPCSGKGTVSKIFCQKYNFEYLCTGDMFRNLAKSYGYTNVLDFQKDERVKEADNIIDTQTENIGKEKLNENLLIDSRLAWHFIPKSFKVFIDVDWDIAGKRLLEANRASEKVDNLNTAIEKLKDRWQEENSRYMLLYKTNNLNTSNYNFVISSSDKTPEEIADAIYNEYKKFMLSN